MKSTIDTLTGLVLPPHEDRRAGAPLRSRRQVTSLWRAWKKWSVLEPMPILGVFLFVQALIVVALLRSSEAVWANALYERCSPYLFGDCWWKGILLSFVAALVLAMIWKWFIVRHYYVRCTSRQLRRAGLPPNREPTNIEL